MLCRNCNSRLDPDSLFCANCGTAVTGPAEKTLSIGRNADNDIILNHPGVSSHHARIILNGNSMFIEDLNSSNGTFVNGAKVKTHPVKHTDVIQFSRHITLDWSLVKDSASSSPAVYGVNNPEILASKNVITIGRTDDNDVAINNVKISRRHARIIKENGVWNIEDLGSSNGTFVNGRRITSSVITVSDVVTIGGIPINIGNILQQKPVFTEGVSLTADRLTFEVDNKTLIDDVTIALGPGEFVGLIGPSGAGKTTLMMMMNGTNRPTTGDVLINSQSLIRNYDLFKGQLGYVPQDDIIHKELKVKESFEYTAKLRFNKSYSESEISQQIERVMSSLDLQETQNTLIGSPEKKGISGGQRKRVNLGQELLTEPSILFLDEPTSGLDPKTDMDVMHLLQKIASTGRIVVLTTHNITVENFNILTHLVVLTKGGKLAYFGSANEAVNYFGVKHPYEIFDTLNSKPADYWKDKYLNSPQFSTYISKRKQSFTQGGFSTTKTNNRHRETDLRQFFILASRYLKIKLRDFIGTLILLAQAPIIAIFIALVFAENNEKVAAVFVMVVAAIWLGVSNAAREIVSEQAIFKRERMVNLKIPSYIFSKVFVLSGLCLLQSLIIAGIVVPSLDLTSTLPEVVGTLFLTSLASLSIGLVISSLVKTSEAAMGLTPIFLIPQVILGGLISKFGDMNDFIKALSGFTVSRWSFESLLITEFGDQSPMIISSIGFNSDNQPVDIMVITLFIVVMISLTANLLKRRDNK